MHPNVYLKTFWRPVMRPQIFVAMDFSDRFRHRFDEVIVPAVAELSEDVGIPLTAFRVDQSNTGDSILSEIIDGIAHCQMVLADVSTVGKDPATGRTYRNGNVMYEVGLALACRQTSEVLLIRDDDDKFLFDISAIAHRKIDSDPVVAKAQIREGLRERFRERDIVNDARYKIALASLSLDEINFIKKIRDEHRFLPNFNNDNLFNTFIARNETGDQNINLAINRLIDKGAVTCQYTIEGKITIYNWTIIGKELLKSFDLWNKDNLPSDQHPLNQRFVESALGRPLGPRSKEPEDVNE